MRKQVYLILGILAILLSSWMISRPNTCFNSNTWCISIGEKNLLIWTKNEIGDETVIDKKSIKPTDVLHVQRYFCGQDAGNSVTHLTIKNNFNKIIKEYSHTNSSLMFEADAPLKDFLGEFISGETIKLYFSISGSDKLLNDTVLLGRLKIK